MTEYKIIGPVNEPGFKGWKLYVDGVHVGTHRFMAYVLDAIEEHSKSKLGVTV